MLNFWTKNEDFEQCDFSVMTTLRDKLGVGLLSGETPCNIPGKCFLMGSLGSQKGVCRYQNRTSRKINLATVVENYLKSLTTPKVQLIYEF